MEFVGEVGRRPPGHRRAGHREDPRSAAGRAAGRQGDRRGRARGRPARRRPAPCCPTGWSTRAGWSRSSATWSTTRWTPSRVSRHARVEVELRAEGRTGVLRVARHRPRSPAGAARVDLHRGLVHQEAAGPPRARHRAWPWCAGSPSGRAAAPGSARRDGGGAEFTVVLPEALAETGPGTGPRRRAASIRETAEKES